jgi:tripartite-type tricarboxylate transporter receptor subunit TctC
LTNAAVRRLIAVRHAAPHPTNPMTVHRRHFLSLAAAAFAAPPRIALAQSYPARPVRLVVGFVAGGPNDILARLIAQWLSERLGQPFIVENMARSNDATAAVIAAPADGYTLLLVGPANAIDNASHKNTGFDFLRDIAPVAGLTREALVMAVHPSLPAQSVAAFVANAKAAPGTIRMAMTSPGSAPYVTGKLFVAMTGVDLVAVPYAGGAPALRDLVAGQVAVMFEPMSASVGPIRAGRLRPLAVTTATRAPALPDVPTVAETVPGFEASAVTGIGAPRDTPAEVVARLNAEVNAAFSDPAMKARLSETGGSVLPGTPAEFDTLFAREIENWARRMMLTTEPGK